MRTKKLLFPALFFSAGATLVISLFAKQMVGQRAKRTAKLMPIEPTPDADPWDAINAYINAQMRRLHIPGAALAIIEDDQTVYQRGFGRARPGGEIPTPLTPFFIGSLTKSFTALAVMQLVEAGKIELDAPVQRYLPWFHVADSQASAQMTVRHLLNQTSGLPMLLGMAALGNIDSRSGAAKRQVQALSTLKLTRPVGSKCEYSNLNYNILGLVIEAASGEVYVDYVQKHIFDPLEMRHSYTTKAAAQQNGLAVGNRHWFSLPFPAPDLPIPLGSLASGQLISCTEDMTHYLIAHLNGGRYGNTQILSSASIDELHRGVMELKMGEIGGGLYGMGWFDIDLGQTKTYSHGGNVPDFSAFMALIPEEKRAAVLLLNADPYGLPIITEEIGMGVTALLAGQQPAPNKLDFIQWIIRLLPLIPLLQVAGVYGTMHMLDQREKNPANRPDCRRKWRRQILLPLIPNLSLTAILIYLRSSGLMGYLHFYNPDLAWIARISGTFAGIWAFLRIGLILHAMRKPQRPGMQLEDNPL
jgi:CubicO group peptidase (beta-lactamase class C family)